jgi:hypothetical protein
MNNTTKSSVVSLILVCAMFLGACGPQNLDDQSYLAQMASADAGSYDPSANGGNANGNGMGQPSGQPAGQAQGMGMGAPMGAVEQLPTIYSQLPTQVTGQPPVITNTAEQRFINQKVVVEQPVINNQPSINYHRPNTNFNTDTEYHTTVYNQPSFANVVVPTATATASEVVLPTTTVDLPAAVAPAIGALPIGYPFYNTWGWVPSCARYLSGGFFRDCAVGPYLAWY